jgi:hypothetical protein
MHTARKKIPSSDDLLGWIGIALGLVAAIILDKGSPEHKWHAAIMWTVGAFIGVPIWGRQKRSSWLFWVFWAVCLLLHVIAMWAIFGQLFPRLILGTLFVIPFAFVESLFLFVAFIRLERKVEHRRAG